MSISKNYKIRYLYGSGTKTVRAGDLTPLKAIRLRCIDCCAGSVNEVRLCTVHGCPLYPFRFGKNPFRKPRNLTEEQRRELAERLSRSRPR